MANSFEMLVIDSRFVLFTKWIKNKYNVKVDDFMKIDKDFTIRLDRYIPVTDLSIYNEACGLQVVQYTSSADNVSIISDIIDNV